MTVLPTKGGRIFGRTSSGVNLPLRVDDDGAGLGVVVISGLAAEVGFGDVSGVSASPDNAIARFSGTSGKLVHKSDVLIDDFNNMSLINNLTTSGSTILSGALDVSGASTFNNTVILNLNSADAGGERLDINATRSGTDSQAIEDIDITDTTTTGTSVYRDVLATVTGGQSAFVNKVVMNHSNAGTGTAFQFEINASDAAKGKALDLIIKATGTGTATGTSMAVNSTTATARGEDITVTATSGGAVTGIFIQGGDSGSVEKSTIIGLQAATEKTVASGTATSLSVDEFGSTIADIGIDVKGDSSGFIKGINFTGTHTTAISLSGATVTTGIDLGGSPIISGGDISGQSFSIFSGTISKFSKDTSLQGDSDNSLVTEKAIKKFVADQVATEDFWDRTSAILSPNTPTDQISGANLNIDNNISGTGNLNIQGSSSLFGVNDTTSHLMKLRGDGTGSNTGGRFQVDTAADHDTTITAYLFQAFQDDLFIGPSNDTDALEYDGGTQIWNFNNPKGVVIDGLADVANLNVDGNISGSGILNLSSTTDTHTISGATQISGGATVFGNLGINTISPSNPVHILATGNTDMRVESSGLNSVVGLRLLNDAQQYRLMVVGSVSDELQISVNHDRQASF